MEDFFSKAMFYSFMIAILAAIINCFISKYSPAKDTFTKVVIWLFVIPSGFMGVLVIINIFGGIFYDLLHIFAFFSGCRAR